MAKNKKTKQHVPYNKKGFLAPDCIRSMSAIHTKIYKDGTCIIRISDCHNSIKIWNNLNEPKEVKEMLEKITTIETLLSELKKEVLIKLPINQ